MARETWLCHTKNSKMVLDYPCFTVSIMRHGSRVKWSNPGKVIAPSPTPWCSTYRKWNLRVTLDYSRQLYFLYLLRIIHQILKFKLKSKNKYLNISTGLCKYSSDIPQFGWLVGWFERGWLGEIWVLRRVNPY